MHPTEFDNTTGRPASPLRTLRGISVGILLISATIGASGGSALVVLNALGAFGLLPLLCTGIYVLVTAAAAADGGPESTVEVAALAWVCWSPVVLVTSLRDDIWRTTPSLVTVAGLGALLLIAAAVIAGSRRMQEGARPTNR